MLILPRRYSSRLLFANLIALGAQYRAFRSEFLQAIARMQQQKALWQDKENRILQTHETLYVDAPVANASRLDRWWFIRQKPATYRTVGHAVLPNDQN